jgi:hypothetical protein
MSEQAVWVVHRWVWGGGGDDDREIVAVCSTAEQAYEIAAALPAEGRHYSGSEVSAFPLDRAVVEA